ncbi:MULTISPECIES: acyltransferase family protein [Candidatus Microthrix]|jgi:peptidoglycan/LPS O-acetylase OafA/YrhL|uniref:Acyltransferase 3 domain-containing protein n=1 Tax=Candidatus Neomicrothrix parvicella RN1 TaxID=1229780 RepID=R4Z1W9_9ACTN|nr:MULTISPECIES: acyltransferase [Microthrix]NLH66530.1 acyltransferase [Candidatus Microthrix parvicella]MBK6500906.1 acyltransferase [Candidatus Microthrix sp.]MBK7021202.1 acyltransferase [Candidatus Microthrix sp.]MBK7323102.1 acyltransferase [Candidatus Microthrix sp.]MBL0206295.1 acyltransferase [Candidatus Microthrix sp.]
MSAARPEPQPQLDAIRGLAVLAVVIGHSISPYLAVTPTVTNRVIIVFGVLLGLSFFPLSAYLLGQPMAAALLSDSSPERFGSFMGRRVARVVPAAWIAVIVSVWVVHSLAAPDGWGEWLVVLGFSQEWRAEWLALGLSPMWTLGIEWLFYLALPLAALCGARALPKAAGPERRARLLMWAIAPMLIIGPAFRLSASVLGYQFMGVGDSVQRWPFAFFDWIGIGLMLAVVRAGLHLGVPMPRPLSWLLERPRVIAGLMIAGLWLTYSTHLALTPGSIALVPSILSSTILPWVSGLGVLALGFTTRDTPWLRVARTPALAWIATVSFGVYLWHWAVLAMLHQKIADLNSWPLMMRAGVLLAISLMLGSLSYYGLERPIADWYSQRRRRLRAQRSA